MQSVNLADANLKLVNLNDSFEKSVDNDEINQENDESKAIIKKECTEIAQKVINTVIISYYCSHYYGDSH